MANSELNRSPSKDSQGGAPTLSRSLGLSMAMAVVVGNVIGSGIFLKPGNIAAESGNFGVILSVWVFGGVLCILGALCFAELATMFPHAGGLYVYLREAYCRPVAFLFGWSEFLLSRPAAIGALAVAFTGSLMLALGRDVSPLLQVALSALLIGGMAWVNIIGVLWGGRVQLAVTLVKAGFLALAAAGPFLMIPFLEQSINVDNYSTTVTPDQPSLGLQVGAVLLAVMWAYNGWHGITPLAEEVRHPQRNIPFALLGGVGVLIVLYLAANIAYHGVLSMEEMKAAGDHAAEQMLGKLFGKTGMAAMSAVIMCSTFGAINTNLLQAPRITFAMGRDGVFFRDLGRVHAEYRTPAAAIFFTAAMAVLLVASVAGGKSMVQGMASEQYQSELVRVIIKSLQDPGNSIFELLTNFVIFTASIFYLLGVFAVIVLRFRDPDRARPYKTWGYPVVPLLFIAVYLWFLRQIYNSNELESRTGLVFIALGIPVYFLYQYFSPRESTEDA